MFQPIYNFLISQGVTNLVDIDGLVYAPVDDLLLAFIRFGFLVALLGLVLVAAACYLCRSLKCDCPSSGG